MKNFKLLFITAAVLIAFNQATNSQEKNSVTVAEEYNIEPYHTTVTWVSNHLGFSNPTGKFSEIEGKIMFDEKKPENSSVEIVIKTKSIFSGISRFDDHLKGKDFFDVKNYPVAKFISKKITKTAKDKGLIEGDLTILGITKSVTLNTKFNKSGVNPFNNKKSIGFSATASVNRSDFGIKYALPDVADKVDLIIEVEANR